MVLQKVSNLDELMRVIAPKQIWKASSIWGGERYMIVGDGAYPMIVHDRWGHRALTYTRWCSTLDESVLLSVIDELGRGLPDAAPPLSQQFPMELVSQDYDMYLGRIEGE